MLAAPFGRCTRHANDRPSGDGLDGGHVRRLLDRELRLVVEVGGLETGPRQHRRHLGRRLLRHVLGREALEQRTRTVVLGVGHGLLLGQLLLEPALRLLLLQVLADRS